MSSSEKKKSAEAQSPKASHSVYDFLYHDARRVGSFLAQFHASGLLQSIKETNEASDTESAKSGASAGLSVPAVANAGGQFENQVASGARQASEKSFDPYWTHAVSLLTELQNSGFLQRDLQKARIGQFVLVQGALSVIDASFMQKAWTLPTISKLIKHSSGNEKMPGTQINLLDILMDMLKILPHPLQAQMDGPNFSVWCGLSPENIVTSPSDIMLKHGTRIAGDWHLLGVLDAEPDGPVPTKEPLPQSGDRLVAHVVEHLSPFARKLLGRDAAAHGVTPILIFREVDS